MLVTGIGCDTKAMCQTCACKWCKTDCFATCSWIKLPGYGCPKTDWPVIVNGTLSVLYLRCVWGSVEQLIAHVLLAWALLALLEILTRAAMSLKSEWNDKEKWWDLLLSDRTYSIK